MGGVCDVSKTEMLTGVWCENTKEIYYLVDLNAVGKVM